MTRPSVARVAVVVPLPEEIDLTNRAQVYDRLDAAFVSGAVVVVADFTGTRFCDSGALYHLLAVQQRAGARGGQLRLVIPPGGLVRRVSDLLGLESSLRIYPTTRAATAQLPPPGTACGPAGSRSGAAPMANPCPAELGASVHPLPCQPSAEPETRPAKSSGDQAMESEVVPFRRGRYAAERTAWRPGPRRGGRQPPSRA